MIVRQYGRELGEEGRREAISDTKQKSSETRRFRNFFNIKNERFAVRTGLEPVTPCVTGMYSNQLN